MKYWLAFFLLMPVILFGQNKRIVDSLNHELKNARHDTAKIEIIKKLAWQYYYSDPEKTHDYVSEMMTLSENAGYLRGIWDGYNIKAILYYLNTQYDSAIFYFDMALSLSEKEVYNEPRIYSLTYLGHSYVAQAEFEKSAQCFTKIIEICSSVKDPSGIAKGYRGLAAARQEQGNFYQSLQHYLKVDSILENTINVDHSEALHNIGLIYHSLGNIGVAKKYYAEALEMYKELRNDFGIYAIESNLGEIEIDGGGNYLKAEEHLKKALSYFSQINDPTMLGRTHHSLGQVYYLLKDYSRSIIHEQSAIKTLEKAPGVPTLNHSYRGLGQSYLALKNYPKALEALNKAYELSMQIGEIQATSIILNSLSKLYFETGNYKKAYETQQQYQVLADSLNEIKSAKAIHELEAKYQNEKKQQEIEILKTQNELKEQEKSRQRNLFILMVTGAVLLAGIFYWLFKTHQKTGKKLKELDSLKSRFFANISHEFRTPLTLISGPIESRLNNGKLNEKDKADFEMVARNSRQLLSLVDQLLDLSKIESGGFKIKIEEGEISVLLSSLASSFHYLAQQKSINYRVSVPTAPVTIWFDKDTLQKIVANLLSNAFKYSPVNGTVNFNAEVADEKLVLTIENSGPGIPESDLSRIFDRFYQVDGGHDGAGIGLALVKELVTLLKGSINVDSTPGMLTTFKVHLPVRNSTRVNAEKTKAHSSEPLIYTPIVDAIPESSVEPLPEEFADEKPVILVVEDNHDVRHFIKNELSEGYKILEAENGREGIDTAIDHIPDLIISDIMMPEMSGTDLCKNLKTDERTNHIPIILLTAKAGEENMLEGLETGADDYITKPFNSEILRVKIENLIELRKNLQARYRQEIVLKPKEIAVAPTDEVFLKKVQRILDEKLSDSRFSAETFSKEIGMSRMQLHRKLKALTGLSANTFIRSHRLKLAANLLSGSDANISEIAYIVGFNDPDYFSKCFKEVYHCTPTEFTARKLPT